MTVITTADSLKSPADREAMSSSSSSSSVSTVFLKPSVAAIPIRIFATRLPDFYNSRTSDLVSGKYIRMLLLVLFLELGVDFLSEFFDTN